MSRLFKSIHDNYRRNIDITMSSERRFRFLLVVTTVFLLALLARVFYLQIIDHSRLKNLAEGNRISLLPIVAPRGKIYSSDRKILADNTVVHSAYLIPEAIPDLEKTIALLTSLLGLSNDHLAKIRNQVATQSSFREILLKDTLTEEEIAALALRRHTLDGVYVAPRASRVYLYPTLFAHIIGYVGNLSKTDLKNPLFQDYKLFERVGKTGLERLYEKQLHGAIGYNRVEVNSKGKLIRHLYKHPPVPGNILHLTLRADLQALGDQALENKKGVILAMDPNTGALLAMVSHPSFDANHPTKKFMYATSQFNRAIQGTYAPGSTIKPFIALAALEHGVYDPTEQLWCPGHFSLPGSSHIFMDWKKGGHGWVDMESAIEQSCDIYFYNVAHQLGIQRMHNFLAQFGFGSKLGFAFPGEESGILPSEKWKRTTLRQSWYPGETVIVGIGQGFFTVTPMQLLAATGAIATQGTLKRPYLVDKIIDVSTEQSISLVPTDNTIRQIKLNNLENWQTIIRGMQAVVHGEHGTARRQSIGSKFSFAGKTGTAQVVALSQNPDGDIEHLNDHAWFMGFAPIDDPKIVVVVLVEHGGHGSSSAAPIARKLVDAYLQSTQQQDFPLLDVDSNHAVEDRN